ncbi:hypothetical protein E1A91_A07G110700v1 [Gossypium mustelinum]|uniref:Uncharacterized protein n=1 Tax=Gossypium mustelinum TaxID=34275 RepID=A0A5D2YJC5_GOSMU|nr:hypothetical protein E1A91_A07G110700v1 [Gossypium mustelinum]
MEFTLVQAVNWLSLRFLFFFTISPLVTGGKLWEMKMESNMVPFQCPNGAYL